MKNTTRNVRIYAENLGSRHGFNIYLDFSGQREFLMYHRHNGLTYDVLKDGMSLGELYRLDPYSLFRIANFSRDSRRRRINQAAHSLRHITMVVNDYLMEREYDHPDPGKYTRCRNGSDITEPTAA